MEKFYTVSEIRLGANRGSDHELLIAKYRLKLKKVLDTFRRLYAVFMKKVWDIQA